MRTLPIPTSLDVVPTFSVIIPTHERAELLQEAVGSVLTQTDGDFEAIVVDDAASESVERWVRELADERVGYLRNDRRRGGAGARNAGIERARGTWVAFLDDDDTWMPTKLEAVRWCIAVNPPSLGMVYTGHLKYDFVNDRVLTTFRPTLRGNVLRDVLYRNDIGGLSSVVIRRDVLQVIGGLDERFPSLQDLELYVRVAQRCTVDFVADPLVRVRKGPETRISGNRQKKLEGARLFAEKYADLVRGDPRLRHRTAARTFAFALAADDVREARRNAKWALGGLVYDPADIGYVTTAMARYVRDRVTRFTAGQHSKVA